MTYRQLTKLREDLLKLYEQHHDQMTSAEENAITVVREFIYLEQDGAI